MSSFGGDSFVLKAQTSSSTYSDKGASSWTSSIQDASTATSTADDAETETETADGNRLAPYNPAHETAQIAALDLLQVTSRDVFFDLGCGDGRLIVAALERCYDDEYLVKVHEERFARMQLRRSRAGGGVEEQPQLQRDDEEEEEHPLRRSTYPQSALQSTQQSPSRATHGRQRSSASINFADRVDQFSRSPSTDISVPHLMLTPQDDDPSTDDTSNSSYYPENNDGVVDTVVNSASSSRRSVISGGEDSSAATQSSALSPPSSQTVGMQRHLSPASPETPVACNRTLTAAALTGLTGAVSDAPVETAGVLPQSHPGPPVLPHAASEINDDDDYDGGDDATRDVPEEIETPSPDSTERRGHLHQISELPMSEDYCYYSTIVDQVLAAVPSGSGEAEAVEKEREPDEEESETEPSWTRAGKADVAAVRQLVAAGEGGAAAAVASGGGSSLGGLRCVGVEYNQALAETAQANLRKSYAYPHADKRVCIRWGDVLDEWNRGRDQEEPAENGHHVSWNDLQAKVEQDATKLTLLDDATAVFVYLLPKGLKKIKPLLREAAARRHRQRERQLEESQRRRQQRPRLQEGAEQQQQQSSPHPLHVHMLRQQSLEKRESFGEQSLSTTDEGFQCPLPRLLLHHRMGCSLVSDITDYDFGRNSRSSLEFGDSFFGLGKAIQEGVEGVGMGAAAAVNSPGDILGVPVGDEDDDNSGIVMPFRVASYMFSIPGWTPSRVDRNSKGGCPTYLYENIHEEKE